MTKIAAKELTEADVRFISLVNRGANRDPFRIMKGDNSMIDLGRIFARKAAKAGVSFIAVSKALALADAKSLVEKAGYAVDNVVEQEDGTIFVQPGFDAGDQVILYRASADVMVGLLTPSFESIKKGYESYNWQSTDFKEVLATEQTIPLFHMALSALSDTFYNVIEKAETPEEAQQGVSQMLNDFAAHVQDVMRNVPVSAFKLETVIADFLTAQKADDQAPVDGAEKKPDAEEAEVEKTEGDASTGDESEEEVEKGCAPGSKKKPAMKDGEEEVEKTDAETDEDGTDADEAGEVEKGSGCDTNGDGTCGPDGMTNGKGKKKPAKKSDAEEGDETPAWAAALLKSVEDTKATVASVASGLDDVKKTVGALSSEVESTKASFAKMDEALGTGVITGGAEEGEDNRKQVGAKKSAQADDDDAGFVMIDTAFGDPFADEK